MNLMLGLLLSGAQAVEIKTVPPLAEPVSAAGPIMTQLRLDLAALQAPIVLPELPASALSSPVEFAGLQSSLASASRMKIPEMQTDALRRVELAGQILGRFDPNQFAKLSAPEQDASLAKLWEGWKDRGLVASNDTPAGEALDKLIVAGVEDRELTSANKSTFLAVGVLGYPLEDALWLQRTRISDALDENNLQYPRGQRWINDSRTPEFLGTTKEAQSLIDAWGAATERGKQLVDGGAPKTETEKAFSAIVLELAADKQALEYLSGQDPTFSAFLLDARKPGYYLYNGDKSIVARIMATKAAAKLRIRRIDKKEGDKVVASTYFYRPARVAARLEETAKLKVHAYDEDPKNRLVEYGKRAKALADRLR